MKNIGRLSSLPIALPIALIVCSAIITMMPYSAAAKEPATSKQVQQLKAELAAAKVRIATLEDDNHRLRQANKFLLAKLKKSSAARHATAKTRATSKPDQPAKASTSAAVTTYASGRQILKDLPADLRLSKHNPWDKFTLPKVYEWLNTEPVGKQFSARLTITTVRLTKNPYATYDKTQPPWQLWLTFEPQSFKYADLSINTYISNFSINSFILYVDEATARRAEKIKKRYQLQVTGEIERITFRKSPYHNVNKGDLTISLKDTKVKAAFLGR